MSQNFPNFWQGEAGVNTPKKAWTDFTSRRVFEELSDASEVNVGNVLKQNTIRTQQGTTQVSL